MEELNELGQPFIQVYNAYITDSNEQSNHEIEILTLNLQHLVWVINKPDESN